MMDGSSRARENFGLMPWFKSNYGVGFTSNTLMELLEEDTPIEAQRRIRFSVPQHQVLVSGWNKSSSGSHSIQLNRPISNTVIVWGTPMSLPVRETDGIEVLQFGGGRNFAKSMKPKLDRLFKRFAEEFGYTPSNPPKIIFVDTLGGGVNVEGAMLVGYDPGQLDEQQVLMTAAHELFHEWLGGSSYLNVKQPESVWFQEGFTDYLSLWFLANQELITPQQFVDRLVFLDKSLANNPSVGSVAFADPDVQWRDGDGPNEIFAYRGGALLAFCADVELRKKSQLGLAKIIKDLAARKRPADNSAIVEWFKSNGLSEFQENYIQKQQFCRCREHPVVSGMHKNPSPGAGRLCWFQE